MLSRVLGFARDLVLARMFGADAFTDAFFVAFKIPNFLRRLFAEGAFATAFVPVLTEYKTQREHRELRDFVDHVAGTLGLVLLLVSLVGVVAAPLVVGLFAFGWYLDGEQAKLDLATEMLRLTFPYLFFISLTAFAGGVMNAYNRFAVPAFTPVLLNILLIGSALWLSPHLQTPITALAWAVLVAGITQFVFQLPFLKQLDLMPRPKPKFDDPGVRRVMQLMFPALFAVSVTQINMLLDTVLASFLVSGSISWLYYSDRLMEFPVGILGVALATVLLPRLSHQQASAKPERFRATLDWGLRLSVVFGLPSAAGLMLLAGPMIAALFQSDAFTSTDVVQSQYSLIAYSVGLLPFIGIKVLSPGYYAQMDTRTPVRIGVIAVGANMVFNLLLVFPLQHAGLALATSLAAALNAFLLWRGLLRKGAYVAQPGWRNLLVQVGLALSAMTVVLLWASPPLAAWLEMSGAVRLLNLFLWIGVGGLIYLGVLVLSGFRPRHLMQGIGD